VSLLLHKVTATRRTLTNSLSFVVIAAVPSQYFSKRRGLANGIMFAGSGFGGAANSFILDALISK
jgi:hypothetical protein